MTGAVREAALNLCALVIVITVIPLVMIQIPGAVAWVVPPRVAAAGPGAVASLLILAAADALGGLTRTVALIGADRALHGAGAGIAMAGVVAVVAERRPRRRPQPQEPNGGRRALAGCWAAFTVAGLATAPELVRHRVESGNWVVALQPFPWLTGAALVLGALYALLAEGTASTAARSLFPAAERTQLALLTVPVAAICAIALAVTYPGGHAVTGARAVRDRRRARRPGPAYLRRHRSPGRRGHPAGRAGGRLPGRGRRHWCRRPGDGWPAGPPARRRAGVSGEIAGTTPVLGAGVISDHG